MTWGGSSPDHGWILVYESKQMLTPRDDLTHAAGILAFHDLALDPPAGEFAALRADRSATPRTGVFTTTCSTPTS